MTLSIIQSYIEAKEKDASLLEEKSFDYRTDVIDFIEFPIIAQLDELLQAEAHREDLVRLNDRAGALRSRLVAIDTALFQRLRDEIWTGHLRGPAFKSLIGEYFEGMAAADGVAAAGWGVAAGEVGYDNLDVFINRLLHTGEMPVPTWPLEPEMVDYHKTPARVVLELVEKVPFTGDDIFVDLGSGLGGTVQLVHLLTGVRARGIEREPAYHAFAEESAAGFDLREVFFVQADVREADLSEGNVFFLFTPFTGVLLQEVMDRLRNEAIRRNIRVITYGPCTAQVARQSWLRPFDATADEGYRLQVFFSSMD